VAEHSSVATIEHSNRSLDDISDSTSTTRVQASVSSPASA